MEGTLRCTLGSQSQHTNFLEDHTWSIQQSTSTHTKHSHNITLLSVYCPFSDRVGLSLHNIPSPFLSVIDIFFVNLKFGHIVSTLSKSNHVFLGRPTGLMLPTLYSIHFFHPVLITPKHIANCQEAIKQK